MQPHQLRKLVRTWSLPVLALAVIGAVVAYLVSKSLTPIYEAKGDVLVVAGVGQNAPSSTPEGWLGDAASRNGKLCEMLREYLSASAGWGTLRQCAAL